MVSNVYIHMSRLVMAEKMEMRESEYGAQSILIKVSGH